MKQDSYRKSYWLCVSVYMAFLLWSFYDNATKGYMHSLTMCFVSLGLLFIVPLGFKIMKWKPVYEIYCLYVIFIFFASLLGSAYRFYDHILYWDKYVHCLSGVLGALLGYLLFCVLRKVKKADNHEVPLLMVFVNAVNISFAALWELFEYSGLVLFDYDGIRHYVSGVHDSMTDIIVCIIGGLFTSYFLYRYYKTGKSNVFIGVYERFYERNGKGVQK